MFSENGLPVGYKNFTFGMTKELVKEALKQSNEFDEHKEEILSIRIDPDREIITVDGYLYIEKAYFHFDNDKLFQIYIKFNSSKLGYYNLLKQLTEKYGKPLNLSPLKASWENEVTRIIIEKESVIKYVDVKVWDKINKSDIKDRNIEGAHRDSFLDGL